MKTVVSTIGTPAFGISKYFVEIIQLTLNKNKNKVQNSTSFLHEAKEWKIESTEIQVSYHVVTLYPSVLLYTSIHVFIEFIHTELKKTTKLNLMDIYQLLELCFGKYYFLYNNLIWMLENSGPIGLSIMVILSE